MHTKVQGKGGGERDGGAFGLTKLDFKIKNDLSKVKSINKECNGSTTIR